MFSTRDGYLFLKVEILKKFIELLIDRNTN